MISGVVVDTFEGLCEESWAPKLGYTGEQSSAERELFGARSVRGALSCTSWARSDQVINGNNKIAV